MGIIKAIGSAISGGLADQWLEVFEADDMGEQTVFTSGVLIRRGQNTKGTNNTVSNGSMIHVYDNQFMMLVDGGKVVDYTAEPGYYKVDNSSLPSMLNGELGESVKETFNRIKYGGQTPTAQIIPRRSLPRNALFRRSVLALYSVRKFRRADISVSLFGKPKKARLLLVALSLVRQHTAVLI